VSSSDAPSSRLSGISRVNARVYAWLAPTAGVLALASRTSGSGCPACAGQVVITGENDLLTLQPKVAAGWHPALNGAVSPAKVHKYSNRSFWWVREQGHE
jgi:hypothetical protein